MSDKIFCGGGKIRKKDWFELEILLFDKDLKAIGDRWRKVKDSKFPAVKLVINERKTPSEKGQTHYGWIDTYEKKEQPADGAPAKPADDEPPF